MENPAPASELERRKQLRVRLRRDLNIEEQKYEGRTYHVVKDPVSLRYYRLKDNEYFLLQYLDGKRTLEDAQKGYEVRYRPDRLKLEDVEAFAQQLINAGLAQNESPRAGKQLYRATQETAPQRVDADADQHSLHQNPSFRSGLAAQANAALGRLDLLDLVFPAQHRLDAVGGDARGDALRDVPLQAARIPRVLPLPDRRLPVGGAGGGQGHPRVRPRTQL